MSATKHTFSVNSFGWVTATGENESMLKTQSVVALLLYEILQRLPDPNQPLAEAVEWETLDGTERTTDIAVAKNWAAAVGIRVVRRAKAVQ